MAKKILFILGGIVLFIIIIGLLIISLPQFVFYPNMDNIFYSYHGKIPQQYRGGLPGESEPPMCRYDSGAYDGIVSGDIKVSSVFNKPCNANEYVLSNTYEINDFKFITSDVKLISSINSPSSQCSQPIYKVEIFKNAQLVDTISFADKPLECSDYKSLGLQRQYDNLTVTFGYSSEYSGEAKCCGKVVHIIHKYEIIEIIDDEEIINDSEEEEEQEEEQEEGLPPLIIKVPVECEINDDCVEICENKVPTCVDNKCHCDDVEVKITIIKPTKIPIWGYIIVGIVIMMILILIILLIRKKYY